MGGNVEIKNEKAHKIPLDKISIKEYKGLQKEIVDALRMFNKEFEKKYNKLLFPKFEENVKSGKLFSGSTRLFFEKPLDEFKKYKQFIGDIDLQYPDELKLLLKEFLKDVEGKKFREMTFFGAGGNSPTQENTIFKSSIIPNVINIQIDFEPTFFEDGVPNEFSIFAHYSSWKDIQNKVKGAFSKILLRALVSSKEKLGDVVIVTNTGKISKSKEFENPSLRKFSVDKGMRVAFEQVLNDDGKIKKSPDGKPMYKKIDTSVSTYERDVEDIFVFIFGKKASSKEIKDFYSFVGLLGLMKKYLDKNTIKDVFNSFMKIIWQVGQEITVSDNFDENGIQIEDFETKKSAYDQFVKVFPELKMSDKELKDFVLFFYQNLKKKKDNN